VINISKLNKFGSILFKIYFGIGVFVMGILAISVIFTVVMRYLFSLSWKEVEELTGIFFAFTTFWAMGLCVLKNEHVVIDVLYNVFPPAVKRWISLINYFVVFVINGLFFYYSLIYVGKIGTHLSKGMMIPMSYYYTIMPVSCFICAICIVIKMVETIKAPAGFFNPDNNNVTE
jgi:C4-dicarboxylate transporter DctQ subunit